MKVTVETKVQTRIIDAKTKRVISESPIMKNLLLDVGLNKLARQTGGIGATYPAQCSSACKIGDGNTPVKIASGAITFTQAGTTLTASGGFFTAAMVGGIFKWGTGTGGNEIYITAFTDSQNVTVDTSATVGTPDVGTVWQVQQTDLVNFLFASTNYETTAGSCGTSFAGASVTHKRTYNFAQQASSYNVNEIGYSPSSSGSTVLGRLVLSATDVVSPTNFYQVILSITFTYSPGTPTAVGDVGTNIDTSGNAMLENVNAATTFKQVQSDGIITPGNSNLDGASSTTVLRLIISAYTQNSVPGSLISPTTINTTSVSWVYAGSRGKMTLTFNLTVSTSGQSMTGIGIGSTSTLPFDVKLTTPFTLPTGSFLPQTVFSVTYGRTLNN